MQRAVGVELAISGMRATLGKDILKEHDLAICVIAVGGTLNFIFVYLPTAVAPQWLPASCTGRAGCAWQPPSLQTR